MLKIMEDEQKIFRAWLFKIVKKDKTITGRELSAKIGVREPTLTAYHSGRKDENGERKFPIIPLEKRELILEATHTTYSEILETGRKELQPEPHLIEETIRKVLAEEKEKFLPSNNITEYCPANIEFQRLIKQFPEPEKALKVTRLALELTQKKPNEIDELIKYLEWRLTKIEDTPKEAHRANGPLGE